MVVFVIFLFKQKTAYELRISDWSSDVCSSDLGRSRRTAGDGREDGRCGKGRAPAWARQDGRAVAARGDRRSGEFSRDRQDRGAGHLRPRRTETRWQGRRVSTRVKLGGLSTS